MGKYIPSRTARIILLAMIVVFAVMRMFLHSFPATSLSIGPYTVPPLFSGVILVIGAGLPLMLRLPRGLFRWVLAATYGTGLALILDEWVYLIVTEGSDSDYLRSESLIGAGILLILVTIYVIALASRKP